MSNIIIKDGNATLKYLHSHGEGTNASPFLPLGSSMSFSESVAMGLIDGYWYVDKFGYNPLVTTSTDPEDVWEGGGTYTFSTSADIVSLSSSEAGDSQDIKVLGQTLDGTEIEQTVTLSGQSVVTLGTPLYRVYRMQNMGTTDITGTVYCYVGTDQTGGVPNSSTDIRAIINNGNNQTLMCIYTIPKGKVAFIYRGEAGLSYSGGVSAGTQYAEFAYLSRRPGEVFKIKKRWTCISTGSSNYSDKRSFPDVVPAGVDLKLTAYEVSEDLSVWGTLDLMLVDEDQLTTAFLQTIGQPGY